MQVQNNTASSKNVKPELGGSRVRQRKRNINAPQDPESFYDQISSILDQAKQQEREANEDQEPAVEAVLTKARQQFESDSQLEFLRYGDTFFQVFFTGHRLAAGGRVADTNKKVEYCIFGADESFEAQVPYLELFVLLLRRKPFLLKKLEDVLITLLLSLEFYSESDRKKLALATAGVFLNKIQVLPDKVLGCMLSERLVENGLVLAFVTDFFKFFIERGSLEDLQNILTKGKLVSRLDEFFPVPQRSHENQIAHFKSTGLDGLAQWLTKRNTHQRVGQVRYLLSEALASDEPPSIEDNIRMCRKKQGEGDLTDATVAQVALLALLDSVSSSGKGQQQLSKEYKQCIAMGAELVTAFVKTANDERIVLEALQVHCYENQQLIKYFQDIVHELYEQDILAEDTILKWFHKGGNPKGRNILTKELQAMVKWLEEAEEEEGDEDDEDDEE